MNRFCVSDTQLVATLRSAAHVNLDEKFFEDKHHGGRNNMETFTNLKNKINNS